MLLAHLPAGYITSKLLSAHFDARGAAFKPFLYAALLGAIAPDMDKVYLVLMDDHRHQHHTLWPHYPFVWACLVMAALLWFYTARNKKYAALAAIFSINGLLHMMLDTVVGNIWWFAPFGDKPFAFLVIPARYNPWWLSYLLHWSFIFELAIMCWAFYLWRRGRAPSPDSQPG